MVQPVPPLGSSRPSIGRDATDDVEGHTIKIHGAIDEPSDDVEGHRVKGLVDVSGDVEGHVLPNGRTFPAGPTDDVEGHVAKTDDVAEGDDVSGHGRGWPVQPDEDDTEGHRVNH